MIIHVWGKSKPDVRGFDRNGEYRSWQTACYSGHMVAESMDEAVKYLQEYIKRGWDVSMKVEPKEDAGA